MLELGEKIILFWGITRISFLRKLVQNILAFTCGTSSGPMVGWMEPDAGKGSSEEGNCNGKINDVDDRDPDR